MLKKWPTLEKKLNQGILWLITKFFSLLRKLIPTKVKSYYQKIKEKFLLKKENFKTWLPQKVEQIKTQSKEKALGLKTKSLERVEKIKALLARVKEIKWKEVQYKAIILEGLRELRKRPLDFLKFIFSKINPFPSDSESFVMWGGFLIIPLSVALMYLSNKYWENTEYGREPASVKPVYKNPRPSYYRKYEKTFSVNSVNFPVYIEKASGIKMLRLDVTITTSNKYTRNYLSNNHHLVMDVFNSKIEPIVPEFPLEEEGKKIIKDKIQAELNNLIKDLKIKGKVEEVRIRSIISG
ncbi:MAG: hypothetical protein ACPGJV_01010 [Bacteriovoracaceae bacterium]